MKGVMETERGFLLRFNVKIYPVEVVKKCLAGMDVLREELAGDYFLVEIAGSREDALEVFSRALGEVVG